MKLKESEPIVLENLRELFARPGDEGMNWHADDMVIKTVIPSRSIIYFAELRADPATTKH